MSNNNVYMSEEHNNGYGVVIERGENDKNILIDFSSEYDLKSLTTVATHFRRKDADENINSFYIHHANKNNKLIFAKPEGEYEPIGKIEMYDTPDGTMCSVELKKDFPDYYNDIKDGLESILVLEKSRKEKEDYCEPQVSYGSYDYYGSY